MVAAGKRFTPQTMTTDEIDKVLSITQSLAFAKGSY